MEKRSNSQVSKEHMVPLNRVYVRKEFEITDSVQPQELGVQH